MDTFKEAAWEGEAAVVADEDETGARRAAVLASQGHRASVARESGAGTIDYECECGVALVAVVAGAALAKHAVRGAGDPRRCPPFAVEFERCTGLAPTGREGWRYRYALEDLAAEAARVVKAAPVEPNEARTCDSRGRTSITPPAKCIDHSQNQAAPGPLTCPSSNLHETRDSKKASPAASDDASSAPRGDASPTPAEDSRGPRLLANQVDTLHVHWDVRVAPAELEKLEAAKKAVQDAPADGPESEYVLGGEKWIVEPKGGRRHQFLLKNEFATLAISKCKKNVSALAFKVLSSTNWSKGARGALEWTKAVAAAIHTPFTAEELAASVDENGYAEQVAPPTMKTSRVDLATDWLDMPLSGVMLEEFVTRPRRRARYHTIDKDDLAASEFWSGLVHTGDMFGKGSLVARVYNKTKEVQDQSPDKRWLFAFWKKCAACGCRENEHEGVFARNLELMGHAACTRAGCECCAFVLDESGFMDARPCAACDATGRSERLVRCSTCRGRGTRGRKRQKVTCGDCSGAGKLVRSEVPVRCQPCRGKGCKRCEQTGKVLAPLRCKVCKGKKTSPDTVWRIEVQLKRDTLTEFVKSVERTCAACAGNGEKVIDRACRTCRGDGKLKCRRCDGRGANRSGPCRSCRGGWKECGRCKGVGRFSRTKLCKRCEQRGVRIERPKVQELANPVEVPGLVVATEVCGARNVGEELAIELDTIDGLLRSLQGIWRYCVGGSKGVQPWISWRRPTENEQRTRWPLREEWKAVQAVEWGGDADVKDQLVRVKRVKSTFERGIVQLAGHLTSAMANAVELSVDDDELYDRGCGLVWREVADLIERREKTRRENVHQIVARKRTTCALWGLHGDRARRRALASMGVPVPVDEEAAA